MHLEVARIFQWQAKAEVAIQMKITPSCAVK